MHQQAQETLPQRTDAAPVIDPKAQSPGRSTWMSSRIILT